MIESAADTIPAPVSRKLVLNEKELWNFWRKVKRGDPDECWPWLASRDTLGYGYFRLRGFTWKSHRVSFQIHHRILANGELSLHKCDNPSCVNPDHLFAGSNADNMRDMIAKGRDRKATGDAHWTKKHPELLASMKASRISGRWSKRPVDTP